MKKIIIALSLGSLTACGGAETGLTPFSSFSAMPQNGKTSINGEAMTASYTANLNTGEVALGPVSGPNNATAVATTTNGVITALSISAPGSSFSLTSGEVAFVEDYGSAVLGCNASGSKCLLEADEEQFGYEYQTYGVWVNGYGTGSGTAGVATFGAATSGATVAGRNGENASYNGSSTGLLLDTDGQPYATVSNVSVQTDFNTAQIQSFNTGAANLNTLAEYSAPNLDFTGSGTVSGDGFTATISGTFVDGTADGIFYGPNAEEVGGTFSSSTGGVIYVGSFGAN